MGNVWQHIELFNQFNIVRNVARSNEDGQVQPGWDEFDKLDAKVKQARVTGEGSKDESVINVADYDKFMWSVASNYPKNVLNLIWYVQNNLNMNTVTILLVILAPCWPSVFWWF